MAFINCEAGNHPNPMRNVYWYIAYGSGLNTLRRRHRYCPRHWSQIEANLSEFEVDVSSLTENGWAMAETCATCGKPITQDRAQVFVTAYPTQDNRKDYWLQIHGHCPPPDFLTGHLLSE